MKILFLNNLVIALVVTLVASCSGGSGSVVEQNIDATAGGGDSRSLVLNGSPPQSDDVQRFRLELWENIAPGNRCGQCHGAGGQSPTFARNDDINRAYEEINALVNLNQPAQSRLVGKVAGGHNCWQASDQACADILTTWISNWAGGTVGSSTAIKLIAPPEMIPGASKSFPASAGVFATTVHPLLTAYCANCHVDDAAIPQAPFFASDDVEASYAASRSKIELDDPANSRLVVRLRSEFHNCWSNCVINASEMEAAIQTLVDSIAETEVPAEFVTSRALNLVDGVVASGGGRNDASAVALYQFKTLSGNTAFDTSGVEPAMNLSFTGSVNWVGGYGIQFGAGSRAQASTSTSSKLHQLITATSEYSVEAWVAPANVTQEEAYIVSYSGGNTARNFTLGQTLYNYDALVRFSETDANGNPALSTPDGDDLLQATLQHVVMTFDPTTGRQLFVNGARIDVADEGGGDLNDWDDTFAFVLGNEVANNRQFQGVLRLVAIHNRALTPTQIVQNFDAGVGEQFMLLFGVSHLVDVPDAYIVFEVSQFDSYSYLFSQPFFYSLDPIAAPSNIPLVGMRIGINGREPEVGQAYANLDLVVDSANYSAEAGQPLSAIGTVLGIEKNPQTDEFFLTFERLGDFTDVRIEGGIEPLPSTADAAPVSDIGIRIFDEINASLSAATGISIAQQDVFETYSAVRQQLPSSNNIEGFLSSQQMGITQLAIEYCNVLMEDSALRGQRFPGFDFDTAPATAYAGANRDALLNPLLQQTLQSGMGTVATQPEVTLVRGELDRLIDQLAASGNDGTRTRTIAKAVCASVLGSAAVLLQ
ncbi:MAG: hypothetical protein ACJAYW_000119 [Candidatus Azotimanducaceae bacterium]|jgi:hypothetical protein